MTRRTHLAAALALSLCLALPATAQQVILVRHAEKSTGTDPGLTAEGQGRAQALADLLRTTPPDLVLTSPARRTAETAAPAAALAGVTAEPVTIQPGDLPSHIRATAERLGALQAGQVALVVGHGNTVPAILRALGGPTLPDLPECAYDRLFRWDMATRTLREERYGAESQCP